MRYSGKDDNALYLTCGRCHRTQAYDFLLFEHYRRRHFNGTCSLCGAPYHTIHGFVTPAVRHSIQFFCIPLLLMLLLSVALFLLSYHPLLLKSYGFNDAVAKCGPLFISLFVSIIVTAVSILPSLNGILQRQRAWKALICSILVLFIVLMFGFHLSIASNYSCTMMEIDGYEYQFFGKVISGKPAGNGRIYDLNGKLLYFGAVQNNQYEGRGELYEISTLSNGGTVSRIKYRGDFVHGKKEGYGQLYDYQAEYTYGKQPGDDPHLIYEGGFAADQYCGSGTRYTTTGVSRGSFAAGVQNGFCINDFESSSGNTAHFEGLFYNGSAQGYCTRYVNGVLQYAGNYINNNWSGQGTYYYSTGEKRYEGEFSEGKYHGDGTEYAKDGRVLNCGVFQKGNLQTGTGTLLYDDGALKYYGDIKDGNMDGTGTWYWNDGKTVYYEGSFVNGEPEGTGSFYNKSGVLTYQGECVNGEFEGYGIRYESNGRRYEGDFVDGLYEGSGKWYVDGKLVYEGGFSGGLFNGYGTAYQDNGTVSGYFKDNELVE